MPLPQQLANYVQTTLASGCTNIATTISVVSAAGLPTAGNFMLRVDDVAPATTFEYMECTGVSGTTLTVTRGQEGTTGIAHSAGAFVGNDLTAAMLARTFSTGIQLYKARAFAAAAQSIPTGANTKLSLNTKTGTGGFDPNGNFDAVTNFRYTAPVSGYYSVMGRVEMASACTQLTCQPVVNGSGNINQWSRGAYGTLLGSQFADLIFLNANDFVELWVFQASGGAVNTSAGSGFCYLAVQFESSP